MVSRGHGAEADEEEVRRLPVRRREVDTGSRATEAGHLPGQRRQLAAQDHHLLAAHRRTRRHLVEQQLVDLALVETGDLRRQMGRELVEHRALVAPREAGEELLGSEKIDVLHPSSFRARPHG
ncbi:MAG: hypothetical protein U0359_07965 [Byssovorax sp.]